MSMTQIHSPACASLLACLTLSSTACTPALEVKPSHPVEVTRYVPKPVADALTRPLQRCTLPAGATWADAWSWGLCSDNQVVLANCRLDRIAERRSTACDALLKPGLDDGLLPADGTPAPKR